MDHAAFNRDLRESRKTLEALKGIAETTSLTTANVAQICEELIRNNKRVEQLAEEMERLSSKN